jgi:hypothetical protein
MNKVEIINGLSAHAQANAHRFFTNDHIYYRYGLFTITLDGPRNTATIMWHNTPLAKIKNPTVGSITDKLNGFYVKFRQEFQDAVTTKQYILRVYEMSPNKSAISLTKLLGRFSSLPSVGYALSRLNMDKNKDMDFEGNPKVALRLISATKGIPLDERVYAYSLPPTDGMYYGSFTIKPAMSFDRDNRYMIPNLPFARDNATREAGQDWPEFPFPISELVRKKYPKIWSKAGTGGTGPSKTAFTGDDAYALFARWSSGDRSPDVLDWRHNRRYRYGSRHQHDFRWRGVIAAIKWGMVLPIGIEAMLRELENKGG